MSYDIRFKDGKFSLVMDGCTPIHWVTVRDALRIAESSSEVVLPKRKFLIRAIRAFFDIEHDLERAMEGSRETCGNPSVGSEPVDSDTRAGEAGDHHGELKD